MAQANRLLVTNGVVLTLGDDNRVIPDGAVLAVGASREDHNIWHRSQFQERRQHKCQLISAFCAAAEPYRAAMLPDTSSRTNLFLTRGGAIPLLLTA